MANTPERIVVIIPPKLEDACEKPIILILSSPEKKSAISAVERGNIRPTPMSKTTLLNNSG
nr:hypothetical protein [Clostridium estertheticum]